MIFSFRWYGPKDPVTLENIRQIPGITGVVSDLFEIPVGEVWPLDKIGAHRERIEAAGLAFSAIESIMVHEDIKLGRPGRDGYIAAYIESLHNTGKAGVPVVTYNFMPVVDWFRSDLQHINTDGSTCLAYHEATAARLDPLTLSDLERTGQGRLWTL